MGSLLTRVIDDETEFRGLRDRWNDLLKNSAADTVFLTWEWLHTWWEIYKKNKELFIIAVEEHRRLIGIAPFYLSKSRFFGLRNLRHVELLGSTEVCSEYLDMIILDGRGHEVIELILDYLYKYTDKQWDVLNLTSMSESSNNWTYIGNYLQSCGHTFCKYGSREHFFIQLPSTIDEYMHILTGKTRRKLRYEKRKLMNEYVLALEEVSISDDIDSHFLLFLDLHKKRWSVKEGLISSRDRVKHLAFHRKVVELFSGNGWLYLVFLKASERIVAGEYNFVYGGTVYNHSVAFDPDLANYSPGSALLLMVLEDVIEKKFSEFDFLRGMEEYKAHWAKSCRKLIDVAAWRSGHVFRIVNRERKIRKFVKKFFPKPLADRLYRKLLISNS